MTAVGTAAITIAVLFFVYPHLLSDYITEDLVAGRDGTVPELSERPKVPELSERPKVPELPELSERPKVPELPELISPRPAAELELAFTREEINEAKLVMLRLINEERRSAGLAPIALGDNTAAQTHAENMLKACSSSHWGLDGLKPYMRYALAGGIQYEAENLSGFDYCLGPEYERVYLLDDYVSEDMKGFMSSPSHRDNILDPHHAAVSLGIASNGLNTHIVQHFEYGYISHFEEKPAISEDGILSMSVAFDGDHITVLDEDELYVSVEYDPPPHSLTQGQLVRTYCYNSGEPVASIVRPLDPGWSYDRYVWQEYPNACPDPYDVPPSASPAESSDDALYLFERAKDASATSQPQRYKTPVIVADRWDVSGNRFALSVDAGVVTDEPGVYTIVVFHEGRDDPEPTPMMSYPIFHGIQRPAGYD